MEFKNMQVDMFGNLKTNKDTALNYLIIYKNIEKERI